MMDGRSERRTCLHLSPWKEKSMNLDKKVQSEMNLEKAIDI